MGANEPSHDVSRPFFVEDIKTGLYDWAHNMNTLQVAALVGAVGTTAIIGFTAKVAWDYWHRH